MAGMASTPSEPAQASSAAQNSHTKDQSPVTGVIDEAQVIIDFGKYEGKSVFEVQEIDRAFYDRLASEKDNGIFAIRRHRDKTFRLYINPLSNMDN